MATPPAGAPRATSSMCVEMVAIEVQQQSTIFESRVNNKNQKFVVCAVSCEFVDRVLFEGEADPLNHTKWHEIALVCGAPL
jgi:hypothetical protein